MSKIRMPKVQFKSDGRLHGKPVKTGQVVEVAPDVARRLIEAGKATQHVETPKEKTK